MSVSATDRIFRLKDDVRSMSAVTLLLVLLPFAGFLGVSVDLARMYVVRSSLKDAIDSSAYAASRTFLRSHDESEAIDMANAVFAIARPDGVNSNLTNISINRLTGNVVIDATATAPMMLIGHVLAIARSMQIGATARNTGPAPVD